MLQQNAFAYDKWLDQSLIVSVSQSMSCPVINARNFTKC